MLESHRKGFLEPAVQPVLAPGCVHDQRGKRFHFLGKRCVLCLIPGIICTCAEKDVVQDVHGGITHGIVIAIDLKDQPFIHSFTSIFLCQFVVKPGILLFYCMRKGVAILDK